nr:SpoIIIAC/SpoIIIAD family protein [Maliibacterium massiliense]
MEIFQVAAIVILAATIALTLRQQRPEMALLLTLATGVLIFFMLLPALRAAVEATRSVADQVTGLSTIAFAVLRMLGIAYISEYGAQLCRDAGERALAGKMEMGGRVLILAMATPFISAILQAALALLGNGS